MNDKYTALEHLVLSFPDSDADVGPGQVLSGLLARSLASLYSSGARVSTVEELARHTKEVTGLTFDATEVRSALEGLEARGHVSFSDTGRHSITIEPSVADGLVKESAERSARTDFVRTGWIEDIRTRYDALEEGEADALWDALTGFLAVLINSRAREAASFLYVEQASEAFEESLRESLARVGEFVSGPKLEPIAQAEFPRFVLEGNPERVQFLTSLLHSAFLFHVLNVDHSASRLVRTSVEGKTLYLDSNFLFRLVALHGPRLAHAPASAVEMSRELNCSLRVPGPRSMSSFPRCVLVRRTSGGTG